MAKHSVADSALLFSISEVVVGIDWEGACTIPWELVEFPLFLETLRFPMDASWNYDENRQPLNEVTRRRWQERKEYITTDENPEFYGFSGRYSKPCPL